MEALTQRRSLPRANIGSAKVCGCGRAFGQTLPAMQRAIPRISGRVVRPEIGHIAGQAMKPGAMTGLQSSDG
jgi:hypothetical protein